LIIIPQNSDKSKSRCL